VRKQISKIIIIILIVIKREEEEEEKNKRRIRRNIRYTIITITMQRKTA